MGIKIIGSNAFVVKSSKKIREKPYDEKNRKLSRKVNDGVGSKRDQEQGKLKLFFWSTMFFLK